MNDYQAKSGRGGESPIQAFVAEFADDRYEAE
jgi:hypothetical protein